ncbi:MAG: AbrB/MazE/SpoVT family DNA-binding domain-containing protein [Ardenticatenaceae bacterium]|nr:AbrB/MazE/SpoVT family DNA-binding domain-containing protein [Ardenticatenaceae bacterium]
MSEEKPIYRVQLRQRGQVTIPRAIREQLAIDTGDVITMAEIDDFVFFAKRELRVPVLADRFAELMADSSVSLADLLEGLSEERLKSQKLRKDS